MVSEEVMWCDLLRYSKQEDKTKKEEPERCWRLEMWADAVAFMPWDAARLSSMEFLLHESVTTIASQVF